MNSEQEVRIPEVSELTGDVIPDVSEMEIYFEDGKVFRVLNDDGRYLTLSESSLRRHLRIQGFSTSNKNGPSPVDRAINTIQMKQWVAYAGPLAGAKAGLLKEGNQRILVTEGLDLPQSADGDFPTIRAVIDAVLTDESWDQQSYFYGWLKISYEALRDQRHAPGQVLALVGEKESGKSLLQAIITAVLGGRSANPYGFFAGRTDFNRELFGAEHLEMGDEISSTDIRSRRRLGSTLKQFTVNDCQWCHAKGKDALTLRPQWRVSISLNDENENLLVLPPLDESIKDKIILLKAYKRQLPCQTGAPEDRQRRWVKIQSEIGAFVSFLVRWEINDELKSNRFGIGEFQHPDILSLVDELAPEMRLLNIIDAVWRLVLAPDLQEGGDGEWIGTATELEHKLLASSNGFQGQIQRTLYWDKACGTYLSRLAARGDGRVTKRLVNGSAYYTITRPVKLEAASENERPVIRSSFAGIDDEWEQPRKSSAA